MSKRFLALLGVAVAVMAFTLTAQAQTPAKQAPAKKFAPKRLPWGDPDLQGNFTGKDNMNTPFERPEEFAGRRIEDITPAEMDKANEARRHRALAGAPYPGGGSRARGVAIAVPIHWFDSLDAVNVRPWFVTDPPDGKVPPQTAEATKRAADQAASRRGRGTADSYTDRSLGDRCIVMGTPAGKMTPALYGASYQILQTKDYVAIRYEMPHETRIIPIQGRGATRQQHNVRALSTYFGESVAKWEGDTLVVDTTNFNSKVNFRGASTNLHLIERYTRTAARTVDVTMTVEDPTTFARPWSFSVPLIEDDGQPIFEYACHEGNYGLRNILSAGRTDDKKGIRSSDSVDAQADLLDEFGEQ